MPTYSFDAFGFDEISFTGPDPFASDNSGNADSVSNGATIRIDPDAVASDVVLTDNEGIFEDGDGGQDLVQGLTLNGMYFGPGQNVEIEYAYVIRPVGSNDPADNITIYVLEMDADAQGIASDKRLIPGVDYQIVSIASNDPEIAYADMAVCYVRGTSIAVPGGECAVEDIQAGDLVSTVDDGPQAVVWCGEERVGGQGNLAPIRIAAGTLGNDRDLFVSGPCRCPAGNRIWSRPRRLLGCRALPSRRDGWWIIIISCVPVTTLCTQTACCRKPCCRARRRSRRWARLPKRKSRRFWGRLLTCRRRALACGFRNRRFQRCHLQSDATIAHSTHDASFL